MILVRSNLNLSSLKHMLRSLILLSCLAPTLGQGCGGPECVVGAWDDAPANVPTSSAQLVADGPFSGNGDLGLAAA